LPWRPEVKIEDETQPRDAFLGISIAGAIMKISHALGAMVVFTVAGLAARADDPVWLRETFRPDYRYHVSTRVVLTGQMTLPSEKGGTQSLAVTGRSAIEYDERILALGGDKSVARTIRHYQRMDFERKVGDQLQQSSLRPEVRRLVLLRLKQMEVPFSPSGPLVWGEIDMVRTDVFTPALVGLLPEGPVSPGATWPAAGSAIKELTDLEKIDQGNLTCRFDSIMSLGKRRLARVTFTGSVRGLGEDGPTRHDLDGTLFFDLESNHLTYLSMKGIQTLQDKDGKGAGRIEGTFVMTRQPNIPCAELADEALRGLSLEPNDDNTLLLYDNPELGLRFLYPRRWKVASGTGRQVGLDETHGNGLLLTVDKLDRVPSGAQYLQESKNWLAGQKAMIERSDSPRRLQDLPRGIETFTIDAEINRRRFRLEYFVIRQAQGGVTVAARLLPQAGMEIDRDVLRIVRSIEVTKQQ
jgi:hypothetical protein